MLTAALAALKLTARDGLRSLTITLPKSTTAAETERAGAPAADPVTVNVTVVV
jgi:hypothetical protein